MNSKLILMIVGLGGAGFFAYKYFSSRAQPALTGNPGTQFPQANPQLVTQPGIVYPYQAPTPTRNDNKSEPWYGGSRSFNLTPDMKGLSNLQSLAGDIGAIGNITSSLTSIWDDLDIGNWFGSGGDDFSLNEFADNSLDSQSFDWSSMTSGFNWGSVV